ncbi:MAG TPA: hypothetical protein VFU38_01630 [Candidatus Krumholzibacteria bacterium]|nr:hypothetical protein [Candidatus Krumholzibacteria bacterium]
MMETLVRKVLGAIAGVVICIAIWSIQDKLFGGDSEVTDKIPTAVWGGGGGTVTIEAEASEPAVISASFEQNAFSDANHQYIEAWQKIPAGNHTFTIDVPAGVSGSVWVRVDEPTVGAKVKVVMRANGEYVGEDAMTLEKPLEPGYGFAAGLEVDDYSRGKLTEEGFLD